MSWKKNLAILFSFLFISCEVGEDFIPENPLDPSNPDYIAPQVSITSSPSENETITEKQFSFSWEGNREGMLYRYALDNSWSGWLDNKKNVIIDHMDEGGHTFFVQSSYTSGDTSNVAMVNFTVDAVKGPSLLFSPRFTNAAVGESFTLNLIAEEVENLSGVEVNLIYDSSIIEIISISPGELFNELGQIIFIEDHNSLNTVNISSAVWGEDEPSATGSNSIAKIEIQVKQSGSTLIEIDQSSSFRDPSNQIILINESIGGIIESN